MSFQGCLDLPALDKSAALVLLWVPEVILAELLQWFEPYISKCHHYIIQILTLIIQKLLCVYKVPFLLEPYANGHVPYLDRALTS